MSIYYDGLDELLTGLRVIEADPDIQATPPPAIYLCTLYDPIRYGGRGADLHRLICLD